MFFGSKKPRVEYFYQPLNHQIIACLGEGIGRKDIDVHSRTKVRCYKSIKLSYQTVHQVEWNRTSKMSEKFIKFCCTSTKRKKSWEKGVSLALQNFFWESWGPDCQAAKKAMGYLFYLKRAEAYLPPFQAGRGLSLKKGKQFVPQQG